MLCLLKTSKDLQILFAAMTHLVQGLSLHTLRVWKWEGHNIQLPSLYNLGTNRTENIVSHTSSVVAC
jgi:hypothetical protein